MIEENALPDTFRIHSNEITEETKSIIKEIKIRATILLDMFYKSVGNKQTREYALAKTNLEQAVMWIVKGATGEANHG